MSIDDHKLRHCAQRGAVEQILIRRLSEGRLDGYTLEASLEIAEAMQPARVACDGAEFDMTERWRCQCGVEHIFGMYAAAHWQDELTHMCDCERERTFEGGVVISCD